MREARVHVQQVMQQVGASLTDRDEVSASGCSGWNVDGMKREAGNVGQRGESEEVRSQMPVVRPSSDCASSCTALCHPCARLNAMRSNA